MKTPEEPLLEKPASSSEVTLNALRRYWATERQESAF